MCFIKRQIFICMTVSQRSLNSNSPVTLITLKLVWRSVSLFFQSNRCGLKKMNRRTVKRGPSLSLSPSSRRIASPLRLKHLVCRLRITTNRQNEVRRCLPPGEYDAAATPHPLPLAEIVPSHRGFWLLGFSNLPLSLVPQAQMGGKESPSEADVKAVLASGTSPITP